MCMYVLYVIESDVTNCVVKCLVVELHVFCSRNTYTNSFDPMNKFDRILTTVRAMTKSFVPFCSAQDGESTDVNCLVI